MEGMDFKDMPRIERNRDNFPRAVVTALARRVRDLCSNSACKAPTAGPGSKPDKFINLGIAAHIAAAAPGGPRYNPNMSSAERRSAENGIWLCQKCAKLVDSDPEKFPAELLRQWKWQAEQEASAQITWTIVSASDIFRIDRHNSCPAR
jgi:hypothetical protein